VFGYQGHML